MARKVLILGASYGSLLGTKLIMAGHDVTLVCRSQTAELINLEGTFVRLKLKHEQEHRTIHSNDQPGLLNALAPEQVNPHDYDMVSLAMQEPQYAVPEIRALMHMIAAARVPCLSIMNMPPLPYLARIPGVDASSLSFAYTDADVWKGFEPGLVSLCSPDPQAFRPPEEGANVLHVGLPTNFKAATFADERHNELLRELEASINEVRLDGHDVPVKLRVFDSLFVPLAKWAMLLAGNYRCVMRESVRSISDTVHGNLDASADVYDFVNKLAQGLGADAADQVPFEKYAKAASSLLKPSSAARAIDAGAVGIERVDRLVQSLARQAGTQHPAIDEVVETVDARLQQNRENIAPSRLAG